MSDIYENPLTARYASREMAAIWGPRKKFSTWRRLWLALAEAESALGLPITAEQLDEMRAHLDDVDLEAAGRYEKELRHDVMAHVHAFGDACPQARPIIHLGATSCFVTDNTELILIRESLQMTARRLAATIDALATFAQRHRELPCLGYTHFQPAQPTTVGKRATLWAYDLVLDLEEVERRIAGLRARSTKGTTGTQASFFELLDGDHAKVAQLERRVAEKIGFEQTYVVTGQTYPRKVDAQVLDALAGVATSAHKAATDLRLLAHHREVEEPQEAKQIGSSAMAYKQNPMRCERICSLARLVAGMQATAGSTAAVQWMERTLDDSAARRVILPQAFLAIDAVLLLYLNVARGLVVYPKVTERNLRVELPFMATENLLMAGVAAGGDRQDLHERIRQHSRAAARVMKEQGGANDLVERLRADEAFAGADIDGALDARSLVGRAPEQVDAFLAEVVAPIRQRYAGTLNVGAEVKV